MTLDEQFEVLDEESKIENFDKLDRMWSTTIETWSEEEQKIKDYNHNTSLSSIIVRTLELVQPSWYNVIQEIKYSEDGKRLDKRVGWKMCSIGHTLHPNGSYNSICFHPVYHWPILLKV